MKLPPIVKKLRKISAYLIAYTILAIVLLSPVTSVYSANQDFSSTNDVKNYNINDLITEITTDSASKLDIRPEESGSPYTPVNSQTDTGANFDVNDRLNVTHNLNMNLTEDSGQITNNYDINSISDYSNTSLDYNIQSLTAIKDYYPVEPSTSGISGRRYLTWWGSIALAQEFQVEWDYAYFYGAKLLLNYFIVSTSSIYEVELKLVGMNISDNTPDITNELSNDLNDPYSETTSLPPLGTSSNIQFFDFTDTILPKGSYYIVANLTIIDNNDDGSTYNYFAWDNYIPSPYAGRTYSMDNVTRTWSYETTYDLNLIPELLPCYANGTALSFSNPQEVNLQDNSNPVNTFTDSILETGNHILTSNTSIQIIATNPYTFTKTYSSSSFISVTNATYWSDSISWDLIWTTPQIDITPYDSLNRDQLVIAPSDWHATVFTFYFNDTNTMSGNRDTLGYRMLLTTNNSAAEWKLTTTSSNYINTLSLYDDTTPTERFYLGYWVGGATDSTGYLGSKIVSQTLVQGDGAGVPYGVTSGTLNYTIYNNTGQIIPIKSGLAPNLIYTDTTAYSLASIGLTSPGIFDGEIYFDPSVSGSDKPGFWTAAVFWQNGTEAGFYAERIVVQSQTEFYAEWETEPSSGLWTKEDISRRGLDSIDIRSWYYNISEPFLLGQNNTIPGATIYYDFYNSTWSDPGILNDNAPFYDILYNLTAQVAVGDYTFDLLATGPFLENLTASFSLSVFYDLTLKIQNKNYQTNYTNNAFYEFAIHDATAVANLSTAPDIMDVTIENVTDSYILTTPTDYNFTYQASTELWLLDISTATNSLDVGLYDILVSIQIDNYRANYSTEAVSDVFKMDITAPKTEIQPISTPTAIFTYHSATFSFNFVETNHSVNLQGATIAVSFAGVENVVYNDYSIGDTYYVEVTNNNYSLSVISVYLDISLDNYQSISNYFLGDLTVQTINTDLFIVDAPTNISTYYEFMIQVQFNDTSNNEVINDLPNFGYDVTLNSSSYIVDVVYWQNGIFNISITTYDPTGNWLNISITLSKHGYFNASSEIILDLVYVETDGAVESADVVTIYYEEGTSFDVSFIDIESNLNVTTPTIEISGDIIISFSTSYLNNLTIIIIEPITTVGTFTFNITISKPGYAPIILQVTITIEERLTNAETTTGESEFTTYQDDELSVAINYVDTLDNVSISDASVNITLYNAQNQTLILENYFEIEISTFGQYYTINFVALDDSMVGQTYYVNITLSNYGYESFIVTIEINFYEPITYEIEIEVIGNLQQLSTIKFRVTIQGTSVPLFLSLDGLTIKIIPNPEGDTVTIYYTFYYADGTFEEFSIEATLVSDGTNFVAETEDIEIPWKVTEITYYATYSNEPVVIESSTTVNDRVGVYSPEFLALLTYLFQEYTSYMAAGLAVIAVILLSLTIYLAVIRPKRQSKKAKKRRYLDKISKILTSVLSMRKVIVVHNDTGLPIYEWDLGGEITVDSSLVSGFLQAVSGMGGEISGGAVGAVRKIDYGQFCVSSAGTDCVTTYLFSTGDISADVEQGIARFIEWFEKRFHSTIKDNWDGKTDEFESHSRTIVDNLSEELFIWTLHPLTVNAVKEKEVAKLDSLSQRIYKFIKDYNEVSISVALEFFNKVPMEEVLSKIFEMVDSTFLLRKRLK